ncbi:MAG: L-threonylcarbamoyladenylate synthase [Bacillota bacterium]|jgi:L-threonylcarbamoyladenylate synthase
MQTEIVKIDAVVDKETLKAQKIAAKFGRRKTEPDPIEKAAQFLKNGQLVAFPTETVYGLGANALDEKAVAQIFMVKGRPSDNPLIVHIAEIDDMEKIAEVNPLARKLAQAFFPGPLTLVLPKKPCIPDLVTAGLATVAVRMPAHVVARNLIKAAGVPIAAPSANKSGRPSPTLAGHVAEDFDGQIPMIIDSGAVEIGLESTVLDLSVEKPVILRPGKIGVQELAPILGSVSYAEKESDRPSSPGMKYSHYAPQAQVVLAAKKDLTTTWQKMSQDYNSVLVLCFSGSIDVLPQEAERLILADDEDYEGYASQLFAAFRLADVLDVQALIVETVAEDSGLGIAIMNRLQKASQNRK